MSVTTPTLDELRREIDEIDDAMHDLLIRRTQVVERVRAAKGNGMGYMRPGREATILRRLAARHTGPFPVASLARMWREMIAALTRMQGPFAVAVHLSDDGTDVWDAARDHYGSFTPLTPYNSVGAVVRAVGEGTATVGVLPWPVDDDPDPWWRLLMGEDGKTPRVVARLPFTGRAADGDRDALAIACMLPEATGDDRSLIGIELMGDLSRGRLKDVMEAKGLAPTLMRGLPADARVPGGLCLVEVADHVAPRDPRLAAVTEALGETMLRAVSLGGYAVPLPPEPRPAPARRGAAKKR